MIENDASFFVDNDDVLHTCQRLKCLWTFSLIPFCHVKGSRLLSFESRRCQNWCTLICSCGMISPNEVMLKIFRSGYFPRKTGERLHLEWGFIVFSDPLWSTFSIRFSKFEFFVRIHYGVACISTPQVSINTFCSYLNYRIVQDAIPSIFIERGTSLLRSWDVL